MKPVEVYARVRHAVLIEGISERAAAERFGINPRTVGKMLKFSVPPGCPSSNALRQFSA
jgi:transposase